MKFQKKIFVSIILLLISLIFSCNKEKVEKEKQLKKFEISVSLSPTQISEITNRNPQSGTPTASQHHLRYVVEIYKEDTDGGLLTRLERKTSLTSNFIFKLESGEHYTILAWADFVFNGVNDSQIQKIEDEYYSTNPLTNVSVKKEVYQLNNSGRDAFSGKAQAISTENKNVTIELKRPFALLNLKENQISTTQTLKITYPKLYTTFDVSTNDVKGETSEVIVTGTRLPQNDNNILVYDYLFTHPLKEGIDPKKGTSLYDIEVEVSKNDPFSNPQKTWSSQYIPFSRNYKTTLTTNFLDNSSSEFQVLIDSNFNPIELNGNKTSIISSYIRTNFYQSGRISDASLTANNDLIMIAFRLHEDGRIYCDLPDNQASFNNAKYLSEFYNHEGVISFNGNKSYMNAGKDLLLKPKGSNSDGKINQFTFGTWIYLEKWSENAQIFSKSNSLDNIYFKLGDTPGKLEFGIDNQTATINSSKISIGKWLHIALVYDGRKTENERVKCYIDGTPENIIINSIPKKIPHIREPLHIAKGLNAKLDETFFNALALNQGAINNYKNNGINLINTDWNSTKTLAYWKYDDISNNGKDSQSWKVIYDDIRRKIEGKNIKLRLGLIGGAWKDVVANPATREKFTQSVYNEISKNHWDGIDLDFEWSYSAQEFNNYSQAIIDLSSKIKPLNKTFSVSLHPVSYKISAAAIAAVDFISLQVYGPKAHIFPYQKFVESAQNVIAYGIPKNKLVMGVPFYGVRSDNKGAPRAYQDFVKEGLIISPDLDQITYKGALYTYNGKTTMRKKVQYIKNQNLLGIMSWDIATDINYENPWSLLKVVSEELKK